MDTTTWAKSSEVPFFRCLIHSINKRILSISYVAGMVLGNHSAHGSKPSPGPCPSEEQHQVGEMTGRLGGSLR